MTQTFVPLVAEFCVVYIISTYMVTYVLYLFLRHYSLDSYENSNHSYLLFA